MSCWERLASLLLRGMTAGQIAAFSKVVGEGHIRLVREGEQMVPVGTAPLGQTRGIGVAIDGASIGPLPLSQL
ncbi:MAG: hypothetical protein A49_05330 [Methyloceanibacter sp.]|nr:MAG: hypothetical protein A49_05330 [Methyloceanibacter sp.]